MKKNSYLTILLLLILISGSSFAEPTDFKPAVKMEPVGRMDLIGHTDKLQSYTSLYSCALYLPHGKRNYKQIMEETTPKRVEIIWRSPTGFETLAKYWTSSINDKLNPEQQIRNKNLILRFVAWMKDVKRGSRIIIENSPEFGTRVYVNGQKKGTLIGAEVNRALMRIWIDPSMTDDAFQKALRGER